MIDTDIFVETNSKPDVVMKAADGRVYLGFAQTGTQSLDEPQWCIRRIELLIDAGGNTVVSMKYPNGSRRQAFCFAQATSYNYLFAK